MQVGLVLISVCVPGGVASGGPETPLQIHRCLQTRNGNSVLGGRGGEAQGRRVRARKLGWRACGSHYRAALRLSLPSAAILTTTRYDSHYHALRFSLPNAPILTTERCDYLTTVCDKFPEYREK